MNEARSLAAAQHEAAHIVVGVALGLRMRRAVLENVPLTIGPKWTHYEQGGVWFDSRVGTTEAWGLMLAAGVAWELATVGHARGARGDLAVLREMGVPTRPRVRALSTAAGALLAGLGQPHKLVTSGLLERDLVGADILTLARGERLEKE